MREEKQQRHDDQAAADAEERAEESGDDAYDRKPEHRSYRMGVDALARLREAPERAAILLDIDGTLAPIVARPEDSAVPDETREVLCVLVDRYGLVGAISGRAGSDALELISVPGVQVVGNHGLELAEEAEAWRGRLHAFGEGVSWPVEDKGVALAYHYRTHPDHGAARAELELVAERARSEGLRTRFGRMVLEVLPPLDVDKGTAVRALLARAGLRRAMFAGDDTTDLDAFGAVDELEVGVKVAVDSAEAPPRLRASADVVVPGTVGLVELLKTL
jgi:trehalose 6-phosphate phosphatase